MFDYEGQFVDFDGSVIEECFPFGHCISSALRREDLAGRILHCASFSNLPIVTEMPLPISAALLANSDLLGFASPFAAFCASVRSDCLCAPTFDDACRFCTWVRTDLNSFVRSWIEDTAMMISVAGDRSREVESLCRVYAGLER